MGFYDAKHLFTADGGQAITASAYSTNEINFGETYPDMGEGEMLVVRFIIETAFTTDTDTLTISIVHGQTTAPTTVLVSTGAIAASALTKGAYIPELKLPDQHLQYVRLYFAVSEALLAGKVTAFLDIAKGMRHR
jgi:hypothetical protein